MFSLWELFVGLFSFFSASCYMYMRITTVGDSTDGFTSTKAHCYLLSYCVKVIANLLIPLANR